MPTTVLLSARKRKQSDQNEKSCTKPLNVSVVENVQREEKFQPKQLTKRATKRLPYEKMPDRSIRFDGINHWINCHENGKKAARCKLEGCNKQTSVYCEKCKVHLCFVPSSLSSRNCFKAFHILNANL